MLKKIAIFTILFAFLLAGCGPRPQYKTRSGKKKLKYYNSLQYNKSDWDKAKKKPKRKN
jgi:hypothetical protein